MHCRLPFDVFGSVAKGFHDAGYTSPVLEIQKYPAARLFSILPAFTDLLGYYTWMYAFGGKEALQELYGNTVRVLPAGMNWAGSGGWGNKKFERLSDFKGTKHATSNEPWKNILSEAGASVEAVLLRHSGPKNQSGNSGCYGIHLIYPGELPPGRTWCSVSISMSSIVISQGFSNPAVFWPFS